MIFLVKIVLFRLENVNHLLSLPDSILSSTSIMFRNKDANWRHHSSNTAATKDMPSKDFQKCGENLHRNCRRYKYQRIEDSFLGFVDPVRKIVDKVFVFLVDASKKHVRQVEPEKVKYLNCHRVDEMLESRRKCVDEQVN